MYDLTSAPMRAALAIRLMSDYDDASVAIFREGNRRHLGASVIGRECEAEIWFGWRWIYNANPGGRIYRLFQRGHREEPFVFQHLRQLGCHIDAHDPELSKAAGKPVQWRMSALHDHYGGSCDGLGYLPERMGYAKRVGFEVKTAKAKHFKTARDKGVSVWEPKYARQMDEYGAHWGLDYFVFTVVCKDDDDKHIEIYECKPIESQRMRVKAERIITARKRPARISDHAAFSGCRFCDYKPHCHHGAIPEKNCRSCEFAIPDVEGTWFCEYNKLTIPTHIIADGCPVWRPIIN